MIRSYDRLSPRQRAVVDLVNANGQVTTSQVRRALFTDGTEGGRGVRCRVACSRLVELGLIRRINRTTGGWGGGGGEHIYLPRDSKATVPDPHTLDITELGISLKEKDPSIIFEPERLAIQRIGGIELKPDAWIQTRDTQYFAEVDRGTEYRAQLAEKMRRYVRAYNRTSDDVFPLVVFIAHTPERVRFIETVIKRQSEPELFACLLFSDAVDKGIALDP